MEGDNFERDPQRVVEAPEEREGTSHWVCDTDQLQVWEVTDPDGIEDPVIHACNNLWELLGKVVYYGRQGRLSEYAQVHFVQHITSTIHEQRGNAPTMKLE